MKKSFVFEKSTITFAPQRKHIDANRGVAQLASVPAWGAGGRPFESDHPDNKNRKYLIIK